MAELETTVVRHYSHGALERAILDGLRLMGRAPEGANAKDLAAVDEFHMGGRRATEEFAAHLALRSGLRLLDIGSGLGGGARFVAEHHGCQVTGVDITPEYVEVATALTRLVGLDGRAAFQVGNATNLPFDDASFDRATLLHVGMNIPDKERLCREARRVLRSDGLFGIYDVMRLGDAQPTFPTPWAAGAESSFLARPEDYRQALSAAGFALVGESDRRALALEMFRGMQARAAGDGPPPLGLHILMGRDAPTKVANMIAALDGGIIAPVELIARPA
jgi:SAM-dependent methyltransferase